MWNIKWSETHHQNFIYTDVLNDPLVKAGKRGSVIILNTGHLIELNSIIWYHRMIKLQIFMYYYIYVPSSHRSDRMVLCP